MSSPVPNLPPLAGVQDQAVRSYLEALTHAWSIRNGATDEKFLTVKDLTDAARAFYSGGGGSAGVIALPGGYQGPISDLIGKISDFTKAQSKLWNDLGRRIEKIEMPAWFENKFTIENRNEIIKQETANSILNGRIDTIYSQLGSSVAAVQTTVRALASDSEALAEMVTDLQVAIEEGLTPEGEIIGTFAAIQSKLTALVTAADASSSVTTTLQAAFTNAFGIENLAALQTALTTFVSATEASSTQVDSLEAAFVNGLGVSNVAQAQSQLSTVANNATTALSQVTTLQSTVNSATVAAQQALSLAQTVDGQVDGSWTVKFDAQGYIVGAGLGLTGKDGVYSSSFIVRADNFLIGAPEGSGYNSTYLPFIVYTVPTVIDGVTVPAGVYIQDAVIANASIDTLKLGEYAVSTMETAQYTVTGSWYGSYGFDGTTWWSPSVTVNLTNAAPYLGRIVATVSLVLPSTVSGGIKGTRIRIYCDGLQVWPVSGLPGNFSSGDAYTVVWASKQPATSHSMRFSLEPGYNADGSEIAGYWPAGYVPRDISFVLEGDFR